MWGRGGDTSACMTDSAGRYSTLSSGQPHTHKSTRRHRMRGNGTVRVWQKDFDKALKKNLHFIEPFPTETILYIFKL